MAGDSGLSVIKGGTGRNFQLKGAIVIQAPDNYLTGPFKAEFGKVKGRLGIGLCLSYIATVDPGKDRFICGLSLERSARWMGSQPETLVLTREFLSLNRVIYWLLELEESVAVALFNDDRDSIDGREVIRVLLAIVDQLKPLSDALAEDEKVRRKILGIN